MKKPHKYNIFHTLFSLSSNKLFLLYYLLCFLSPLSISSANNDLQQLLSFKSLILDSSQLPNWSNTNKLCDFVGVTCNINSNVVSIDLSIKKLLLDFKAVSSFLLTLPNLETLLLKNTYITGKLKLSARFQCSSVLTNLDLAENSISGPISDISSLSSCIKLKFLNLSGNLFEYPASDSKGLSFSLKSLDISYNKIVGPNFVPWLLSGGCSELRYLSLKGNKIAGPVLQVQDCKQLEFLDLSSNNFSIGVPKFDDFLALNHLDLSSNKFYGDISASISSCKKLTFLNISQNELGGGVIPFMSSGNLKYLYLSANGFQGFMPPHLSDLCSSLVELDVSANSLTGFVPESFGACSSLELLDISNNNFSGKLPIDTLLKLSSLKNLMFGFNNFVGELSASFSEMTKLETLDVSSNLLHGSVPVGICQDPRNSLKVLYLQNNKFTGRIPDSLSNCSQLEALDLSFNYLDGTIPSSLGSLSNLRDLILWLNQLHGRIPEELMYIKTLENLILDFNDLTGSIPSSLSNCTRLNWISLSNNQLTGEIPASFGQLTNLTILKLGNNSLTGSIPSELGDCRSLIWMDLNTNFLSGTIPPALFKQSGNIAAGLRSGKPYGYIKNDGSKECHGAGNLLEFGGIRQEQKTRISTRHPCNFTRVYWGITRPTFHNNGSIIFLDLSYNKLVGCLPKELGSMYYVQILNLGHNDLSCAIPEDLGKMRSMAILDLSYNRLNGSIPPAMTSLNFLVDIDLSNNYLSGMIPESAPFDTFPEYRFLNNSGLCGYPLPRCVSGKTNLSSQNKKSSHRQASLAASVAMGLLFSLFCICGVIFIAVEARKRRKKKEDALEAYMESHSHSGTANSGWKLTSAREAMSISLATFDKPLRKLTFADLLEATNGFHDNTLVGSGGFGHVYRAQLKDGSIVAVKKLGHVSGQGDREFRAEMETIGKIKHRNLVPLLGYCKVGDERLLVYEYMKFGSLEDVLHDRKETGIVLNWAARRKIAIGAARGLAFLQSCDPHIIHRDMKSSNVLLDESLEARVSDFGLAREMNAMDTHLSVSTLAGTLGYVPPEYQSFKCTTKGDVYSYGIVLLELLTGRRPTHCSDFGDNNLLGWVRQHTRLRISNVFDPHLLKEDPSLELELLQHLKIACACSDDRPWRRPTMIQVMAMFKDIQAGSGTDSLSTIGPDDVSFAAVEGGRNDH